MPDNDVNELGHHLRVRGIEPTNVAAKVLGARVLAVGLGDGYPAGARLEQRGPRGFCLRQGGRPLRSGCLGLVIRTGLGLHEDVPDADLGQRRPSIRLDLDLSDVPLGHVLRENLGAEVGLVGVLEQLVADVLPVIGLAGRDGRQQTGEQGIGRGVANLVDLHHRVVDVALDRSEQVPGLRVLGGGEE